MKNRFEHCEVLAYIVSIYTFFFSVLVYFVFSSFSFFQLPISYRGSISKDGGDFSLKDDFLPSNFSLLPLKIIQQKQM